MQDTFVKIKNAESLATSDLRRSALLIAESGLRAIDTKTAVKKAVSIQGDHLCINESTCSIKAVKRIFVVGVGKCATEAAEALEDMLGDRLAGGIVLDVKLLETCTLKKIKCFSGTHPFPTDANVAITREIVTLLDGLKEDDLVIVIVSGGGSTLLCLPAPEATCVEESMIVQELMRAGATIHEINTVRKHMSRARGGHLARYAHPAQVISLIFSDVPGNTIEFVASGPTMKDTTTVSDANMILSKYDILEKCGLSNATLIETPKDDIYFQNVMNIMIVSNELALGAMGETAKQLGFISDIRPLYLKDEACEVGKNIIQEIHQRDFGACILAGGETTVTIKGPGKGGRNQELALSALRSIEPNEVVLTLASDGRDNGEYAGVIIDSVAHDFALKNNLDIEKYLSDNNATLFFEKGGGLIATGNTGSNVSDLLVVLKGKQAKK